MELPKSRGFTLIELLITVSIMALLMSIAIPSFTKFFLKSRDTKRKADIKIIQSALEQYRADQGYYPATPNVVMGNPLRNPAATKTYLMKIPVDPLSGNSSYPPFVYTAYPVLPTACDNAATATYCTSYCLYANMEDNASGDRTSACPDDFQHNFEAVP